LTIRPRRTRLTAGLAAVLFVLLLLFGGALQRSFSPGPVPSGARLFHATLAVFYLALIVGLAQMRPLARLVAGAAFCFLVFSRMVTLLWAGIDAMSAIWLALLVFGAGYLLLPSTLDLFAESTGLAIDRALLAPLMLLGTLLAPALWLLLSLGVSPLVGNLLGASVGLAFVALLASPGYRRLLSLLGPRPHGLDAEAARAFRSALWARLLGDVVRAEALLAGLPFRGCVAALRGLMVLDSRRDRSGLDRVVLEAAFSPKREARVRILDEARSTDLEAKVGFRTQVVDALVEEAVSPGSTFGHEAVGALERITGAFCLANTAHQLAAAWHELRPRCTDGNERRWLAARLLGAGCPAAAAEVLGPAPAPLARALHLARLLEEAEEPADPAAWVRQHALELVALPGWAEGLGILRLDAPRLEEVGLEAVADRLEGRVPMIDAVRDLWRDYEDVLPAPWIVVALAGYRTRLLVRSRFERWWSLHRLAQEERDRALAGGLRWAGVGDWDAAAHEFGRAATGGEPSSVSYSQSLCLMKLGRLKEAVDLLVAITAHHPRDGSAWGHLAEAYHRLGQDADARAARERAMGFQESSSPTSWKARLEAMDQTAGSGPESDDDHEDPDRLH
jgi:hypothetical protein